MDASGMHDAYDAVVIGGGPGGATAGYYLARAGLRALIVEREAFPRYCVGESLLPYILEVFRDMDFLPALESAGFVRKNGAAFGASTAEQLVRIKFTDGLQPEYDHSFQVERDRFDAMLLDHARAHGADFMQGIVDDLRFDGDRVTGVRVKCSDGSHREIASKLVVDASGRAAFVGRKLKIMTPDPKLDTASVFGVYAGVPQMHDAAIGDPVVLTFKEGWFWFIPFTEGRFSVGVVVDRPTYDDFPERSLPAFMAEMIRRAGGRVANAMANATPITELHVLRKFSRWATQFAGPGWVLTGDAAMFIDPVFAAGVYVAVMESQMAMQAAIPALKAGVPVGAEHFTDYTARVHKGYEFFARFIYSWQDPAFRKFFFATGPRPRVLVQTITTILAGGVFDTELIARGEAMFFKFAERDKQAQATT